MSNQDDKNNSHLETQRQMQICNACRYCEGFCAVFPAMERRRIFTEGDTAYLANLCHNCGACYHACQYSPPHEFAVNIPKILAERRLDSYEQYAWPQSLSKVFQKNGMWISILIIAGLTVVIGLMLALISPKLFWGIHLGEGAFYKIMPHNVMAGIPMAIVTFVLISFVMSWRKFWRAIGAKWSGFQSLFDAIHATLTMRYLGGDNTGKGEGCPSSDDRASNLRKYFHHCTFYGFMLCFASTSVATIYHYVLGREAPYGYFELPVVLGTVGGFILCIGTAGLWYAKKKMDKNVLSLRTMGMDYAFIFILFWVSATGLILLFLRESSLMGITLAIHLAFVYTFFLVLPFSKFVHGLYRFASLIFSAKEYQSER